MRLLLAEMYGELFIDDIKRDLVDEIRDKYPNNHLPSIVDVKVSSHDLPDGKIAKYDNGLITVHPKALGDREYLRNIMLHELIHAAFGERCCGSHHWGFEKMADDLGLPEKHRD